MAPGLNDAGGGSKNKCGCSRVSSNSGRARVPLRDVLANAASLPWESESERRRRAVNQTHGHSEATSSVCQEHQHQRDSRHSIASSASLVDNDNGELSWGLNQNRSDCPTIPVRPQARVNRPNRSQWLYADRSMSAQPSASQAGAGNRPPNRQQVANKLTALQGYIDQTEAVMRELRASDAPGCAEQYEKLSTMLADLRDSERKLQALLRTMDTVDAKIDQLLCSTAPQGGAANGGMPANEGDAVDEHSRKVMELERQREELLAMHELARQRLMEVEQDRAELVQRAQAIQVTPGSDSQLADRINRLNMSEVFREPAERPDEDRAESEVSYTETDYQLMREKGEELKNLKMQLEQMQNMVAILGSSGGSRVSAKDFDEAKAMVSRVQELNRMVDAVRMQGREQSEPSTSREERSMDSDMRSMTRQLEAQTVKMKEERDSLVQAQTHLKKLKQMVAARMNSSAEESDNESEAEPPTLLPVNMISTPRNVDGEGSSRSGSQRPTETGVRAPPRTRQRSVLNQSQQSLPTLVNVPPETLDRRRKEPRSSQSSVRNGDMGGARTTDWSPDMINQEAMYQTQNQLEESAQLCEQMLQESAGQGGGSVSSGGPAGDLTGMLYSQQQMLARTVSQCCKLIWIQQRQINELRNSVMLQQSTSAQQQHAAAAMPPPPSYPPFAPPPPMAAQVPPPQLLSDLMQLRLYPPGGAAAANGQLLDCLSPEQMGPSGALNNQVPPGNRANNYWDNFRSYSRQNLLSTSKSNENSEPRRQAANQDRTPQAIVPPNNQAQYPVVQVHPVRHTERAIDIDMNQPGPSGAESMMTRNNRTCEVAARRGEPEGSRGRNNQGPGRNRTQADGRQDAPDESPAVRNNTGGGSMLRDASWEEGEGNICRLRNRPNEGRSRFRGFQWDSPQWHAEEPLTRVRNDTGNTPRNRTSSEHAEATQEEIDRPNNRFAVGNLNNQQPNSLRMPTTVYQEVTSLIRANETRPNYLIQLFRDLQQVNSDPQRQRALQSLQDVVGANNITQEARNNIRHDNRSNLRRLDEETAAVDELFDQLRENQNTLRANLGRESVEQLSSNLENPNISNIRDLNQQVPPATTSSASSTRNNLEHNRMRDLQSYFEGNLCHIGPGSSLKNPNLSNIRENLTEGLSEYQMSPKNVYRSLYDRLVEDLSRRSDDGFFREETVEPPLMPEVVDRYFIMADREEGPFSMEERRSADFLPSMGYPRDELDVNADIASRKPFLFSPANPASTDGDAASSRPHDWHHAAPAPLSPIDNPYTMFVRPVRYQEPAVLTQDDADLAEADQTRSTDNESISMFVNRLTKDEEVMVNFVTEESPAEDTIEMAALRLMEASCSTEADANENLLTTEGNNNVIKTCTKNRREGAEGGAAKVTKARLQDVLCGAAEAETAVAQGTHSPPMMDIAGALEHLSDMLPQREDAAVYVANDPNLGMEADAERESGLDQVPTRLQRSDSPSGERDPM